MKDDLTFSEVALAYSANLSNLDEARQIFENECRNINNMMVELVNDKCLTRNKDRSSQLSKKFAWGEVNDSQSSRRPSHWLSFAQVTTLPICIKTPERKKFENNVAFLHFDLSYDSDMKRHMFKVRFQNDFQKHDQMDEKIVAMAVTQSGKFRNPKHIKQSCGILGVWEIDKELAENLNNIILNSMDLVQEMVNQEFPDSLYVGNVVDDNPPSNIPDQDVA